MEKLVHELARIVQAVAITEQPIEQLNLVVESIHQVMDVDVCSLYLANNTGDMILQATHGLDETAIRHLKLPAGIGLVGLVASSRHFTNIAVAGAHPNYYFTPGTGEEEFASFCGVPLVNSGRVIGVLVVQCRKPRLLSQLDEGFLVTLAAHLALLLATNPLARADTPARNDRHQGVKGAAGVGIGYVHLCDSDELYSVADAPCADVEAELKQWRQLLAQVAADISRERLALGDELSESVASIFTAYLMLLEDPSFGLAVEDGIRAENWLPGALRRATKYFAEQFLSMDDPYLKARHEDIHYLGNKIYGAWCGLKPVEVSPDKPIVLVGAQVSVSDIATFASFQLEGIVCFEGSGLSHTAVLANALGVPAVMGTGTIRGLANDTQIIVDGDGAQVLPRPSRAVLREFKKLVADHSLFTERLKDIRDLPAITPDGISVSLFTNTGLLADISPGLRNGAQGIGLYRTEIPFMIRDSFPSEDEQVAVYRQVLQAYEGKPVQMRTLDIGGDKQLPYFPIENEDNPALGWRGIRFTLDNSQLMMTQLRAMLRASIGYDNLRVLLPMITSSVEIDQVLTLLCDALKQLENEGYSVKRPPLGVMIEVPAAISQIPFWKGKVDFLSIGSNDLSQYLLALDRNNPRVASRYDHIHPAVLHEIQRIVNYGAAADLPLSLCGEMASDPEAGLLLLGLGIRTLSMSASRLPYARWLIRSLPITVMQDLAQQSLKLSSPQEIRARVRSVLEQHGLTELFN